MIYDIKFTKSARKHKIGISRALYVISNNYPLSLDNLDEINWIGADQRGLVLEIHGFVEEDVLRIIHVMPHRFRRNK
jgi:hypothetical protein